MKSKLLQRRAADEAESNPAPSSDVLDFVRQHKNEIERSDKEAPEFFRDLHAAEIDGEIDPGNFLVPISLKGSPHGKDAEHLGNNRVFLKRYAEEPGVFPLIGEHGAFGVAMRISAITEPMLDDLKALSEPEVEDVAAGQAEHAEIDGAWEEWAQFDFIRVLETMFTDSYEQIDALDEDQTRELFDMVRHRIGLEWEDSPTGPFIDVQEIANAVTEDDLHTVTGTPQPIGEVEDEGIEEIS